jgi:hypothetical protein
MIMSFIIHTCEAMISLGQPSQIVFVAVDSNWPTTGQHSERGATIAIGLMLQGSRSESGSCASATAQRLGSTERFFGLTRHNSAQGPTG